MLKLYRHQKGHLEYWEAWSDKDEVTVHFGIVGQQGNTSVIKVAVDKAKQTILRESKLPRSEGFKEFPSTLLQRVIVQYPIDGFGSPEDLNKRIRVENLMNQCLGWTGLGHCDGGDIGSGTMNVFCFVVDAPIAVTVIVAELEKHELLSGAIVAVSSEEDDVVKWPPNYFEPFEI